MTLDQAHGEVAFNPSARLTRATVVEIWSAPAHRQLVIQLMEGRSTSPPRWASTRTSPSRSGCAEPRTWATTRLHAARPGSTQSSWNSTPSWRSRGMADLTGARSSASHHPRRHRPLRAHVCAGTSHSDRTREKGNPAALSREKHSENRRAKIVCHARTRYQHRAADWRNSSTPEWMLARFNFSHSTRGGAFGGVRHWSARSPRNVDARSASSRIFRARRSGSAVRRGAGGLGGRRADRDHDRHLSWRPRPGLHERTTGGS